MVVVAVAAPRLSVTEALMPPFDRLMKTLLEPPLYDMVPLVSPRLAEDSVRMLRASTDEPCVEESPV